MNQSTVLNLIRALSPALTLLIAAAVAYALPRRSGRVNGYPALIAVAGLVLALALAWAQPDRSASLASIPLGPVSVSLIELRFSPVTLSWMLFLFAGIAALTLVSSPSAAPMGLLLVAAASISLMVGTFPALCLAWFLLEITLAAVGRSPAPASAWYSLLFSTGAVLVAFHASASDAALVLSLGSLSPLSWLLLLVAAGLRTRWWAPAGISSGDLLSSTFFLVASGSAFFTLSLLELAPRPWTPPTWLALTLILILALGAGTAWVHRRLAAQAVLWSAGALLLVLLVAAAYTVPPSASLGAAAAQVLAAMVMIRVAQRLPIVRSLFPPVARGVTVLAALTLLPWPILPFGRVVAASVDTLAQTHAGLAVAFTILSALPASALLGSPLPEQAEYEGSTSAANTLLAILATLVMLAGAAYITVQAMQMGGALTVLSPGAGTLLLTALGSVVGLAAALADRVNLLGSLGADRHSGTGVTIPNWTRQVTLTTFAVVEIVLRFLGGETSVTWAMIIGAAILILASGA